MQLNEVKKKVISGPVQNDVHTQREKRSEKYVGQSRGVDEGRRDFFFACVLHETGETLRKV